MIATDPCPGDRRLARGRDDRAPPELLPRVHLRLMNLDRRDPASFDRIAERERVVGERAGVDHDRINALSARAVHPADQVALVIGLSPSHVVTGRRRRLPYLLHDLLEGRGSVGLGRPSPQRTQVRT